MISKKVFFRLLEFFVIGLVFGIVEDLLAIHFATDSQITWKTIWIAFLVALPFAVISELIVDMQSFRNYIKKLLKNK